mgnify:CR=1 FL=1
MTGKQNGLNDSELINEIKAQSNARKSNLTIIKYVWEHSNKNLYDSKEFVYNTLTNKKPPKTSNDKPQRGAKVVKLHTNKD